MSDSAGTGRAIDEFQNKLRAGENLGWAGQADVAALPKSRAATSLWGLLLLAFVIFWEYFAWSQPSAWLPGHDGFRTKPDRCDLPRAHPNRARSEHLVATRMNLAYRYHSGGTDTRQIGKIF